MRSQQRAGFTLIEMMVAMALTLLVMTILSQAFVMALNTFSGLKGLGDMQGGLRVAGTLLRADLGANHFEGDRRLSNLDIVNNPPQAGFFVVKHGTNYGAMYRQEGTDASNVPSNYAIDHFLYLTVRRNGNRTENFFTTSFTPPSVAFANQQTTYALSPTQYAETAPTGTFIGNAYSSQWAEVAYYLVLNPELQWATPTDTAGVEVPTFSLYRTLFVMTPNSTHVGNVAAPKKVVTNAELTNNAFAGMSCNAGGNGFLTFNSPQDAAQGHRTLAPGNLTTAYYDDTQPLPKQPKQWTAAWPPPKWSTTRLPHASNLVLSNVISFEVQILKQAQNTGVAYVTDASFSAKNLVKTGNSGVLYDTVLFNNNVPVTTYNNRFSLKAIQVTLRLWNSATRQTRQSTFVQDL